MLAAFIITTVGANVLVLALDRYPINVEKLQLYEYLNYMFTVIYVIEIWLSRQWQWGLKRT